MTFTIAPFDVLALRDGAVGWATARLPSGRAVGVRRTAVFCEEDGGWKAVQIHGSIGIPDAGGVELAARASR